MQNYYTFSLTAMLLASTAGSAFAQEPQTVAVASDAATALQGVISYTPADFAAARPNTALEMINRLPVSASMEATMCAGSRALRATC